MFIESSFICKHGFDYRLHFRGDTNKLPLYFFSVQNCVILNYLYTQNNLIRKFCSKNYFLEITLKIQWTYSTINDKSLPTKCDKYFSLEPFVWQKRLYLLIQFILRYICLVQLVHYRKDT